VPPLDIVLPIRIARIEKSAETAHDPVAAEATHAEAYAAGYEEGKLRAEWEAARQRQKESEKVQALMTTLRNLHVEFEGLLSEHLPDLVQGALHRVFRKHPFTTEEIGTEICALLQDMEQASRITLECAPSELVELTRYLEKADAVPDESSWSMGENPALHPGEFVLKSDLGDVDGRHSSRMKQIHLALEAAS